MNKKEYAKLIIEVTTVATKAKLLVEQVKQTSSLRQTEFDKADAKIAGLESVLASINPRTDKDKELQSTISVHRNSLRKLAWDLKTTIETPIHGFKKQADNIKKTFAEKILAHPGLKDESGEFDLSNVHEQIAQTKATLDTIDAELSNVSTKLHRMQEHVSNREKIIGDLALNHDVMRAAEANQLHKKCCDIESTLERNPGLRAQISGFTPLRKAMHTLSLHERTLWREAEQSPEYNEPSIARSDLQDNIPPTELNSDNSTDNADTTPRSSSRLSM